MLKKRGRENSNGLNGKQKDTRRITDCEGTEKGGTKEPAKHFTKRGTTSATLSSTLVSLAHFMFTSSPLPHASNPSLAERGFRESESIGTSLLSRPSWNQFHPFVRARSQVALLLLHIGDAPCAAPFSSQDVVPFRPPHGCV